MRHRRLESAIAELLLARGERRIDLARSLEPSTQECVRRAPHRGVAGVEHGDSEWLEDRAQQANVGEADGLCRGV